MFRILQIFLVPVWCPKLAGILDEILEYPVRQVTSNFVVFKVEKFFDFHFAQVLSFLLIWHQLVQNVSIV